MSDEDKIQFAALGLVGLLSFMNVNPKKETKEEPLTDDASDAQGIENYMKWEADRLKKREEKSQEMETPGADAQGEQEMETPEPDAQGEQEMGTPEPDAQGEQEMGTPEPDAQGEQEMGTPEPDAQGEQEMGTPEPDAQDEKRPEVSFNDYLVKFWNLFREALKEAEKSEENPKLSKVRLWTFLNKNQKLKKDLNADRPGARNALLTAMDENQDGAFSRMEFAVFCAHKLFGTKPITNEVAIRQFYYDKDETGGWSTISKEQIDAYKLDMLSDKVLTKNKETKNNETLDKKFDESFLGDVVLNTPPKVKNRSETKNRDNELMVEGDIIIGSGDERFETIPEAIIKIKDTYTNPKGKRFKARSRINNVYRVIKDTPRTTKPRKDTDYVLEEIQGESKSPTRNSTQLLPRLRF
jgi:hypothetical protein